MICSTIRSNEKTYGTKIRLCSEPNKWDFTFAVGNGCAKRAKEILLDTWELWWSELCTYYEDLTMFEALEISLENEGIPFRSYSKKEEDLNKTVQIDSAFASFTAISPVDDALPF